MNYREFKPGIEVSELIFGTMRYMPTERRPERDAAIGTAALNTALDMGIYTIHSSHEYGTQEATGKILAERSDRDKVLHIIKSYAGALSMSQQEFSDWIDDQIKVLSAERIDILQVRGSSWEDEAKLLDMSLPLVDSGKIGATGVFTYVMDQANNAMEDGRMDGLIAYVNPMRLHVAGAYPLLAEAGKKMIPIQAMAEGAFSDRRTSWKDLPEGDSMKGDRGKLFLDHRDRIEEVIGGAPESWTSFAMGFLLDRPETAGVVASMNKPEQVTSLVEAVGKVKVDDDTFNKLVELFNSELIDKVSHM